MNSMQEMYVGMALVLIGLGLPRGLFAIAFGFSNLFLETNWFLFAILDGILFFKGVLDHMGQAHREGVSHDYEWTPAPTSTDSLPSLRKLFEESPLQLPIPEDVKLVVMQCPNCSAPLSFGNSNLTKCSHCGKEVLLVS